MPQNSVDIIQRCLDNTAPISRFTDMGILYFARTFFERCREAPQSDIHYKMMQNALSLFDPKKRNITERQIYIKVFREAAKSTMFSYVFPLFLIHHCGGTMAVRVDKDGWEGSDLHDYDIFTYTIEPEFLEIFSETHASAERFTSNIRNELETNTYLRSVYGRMSPQGMMEERSNTWRRDVFTLPNGFIVYGNGSGQQSRGMLVGGKRPSLAIFDDIYSRRNTLTEDAREKIRYWFYAEAMNSVDTVKGKAILVGTMVHEDTVFTDVAKQSSWTGFDYPVISEEEMGIVLGQCKFDAERQVMEIPAHEDIKILEDKLTTLAWKERQGLFYLLSLYRQNYEIGRTSYFYQEKLNILMSPDDQKFTEDMVHFTSVEVIKENNITWVKFDYNSYTWYAVFNPIISVDPASGDTEKSDKTAVVVSGEVLAFPYLHQFDVAAGQHVPYKAQGMRCNIIARSFIGNVDIRANEEDIRRKKMDLVQLLTSWTRVYNPRKIAIEAGVGTQGMVLREISRQLKDNNVKCSIIPHPPVGDKHERIRNTLLPIMQSAKITILNEEPSSYIIWHQLAHLGVAKNDDGADAFQICASYFTRPRGLDYQYLQERDFRSPVAAKTEYDWEVG